MCGACRYSALLVRFLRRCAGGPGFVPAGLRSAPRAGGKKGSERGDDEVLLGMAPTAPGLDQPLVNGPSVGFNCAV